MKKISFTFSKQTTDYYLDADWNDINSIALKDSTVLVTDQNVFRLHKKKFEGWRTIVIPAGEEHKQQHTADKIIQQLITQQADRSTTIVGVGGGVVTDITGYVASIYLRGVKAAFVPTTLLAMVDAANGGKNGIDVGEYKNLVGSINQPQFIFYDLKFLRTLPEKEFCNGCAEMIKHGCIKDVSLFKLLSGYSPKQLQNEPAILPELIEKNVLLKSQVVQEDEFEKGDRALLNFGHTVGHAIENRYRLMHGEAISIGMVIALRLSEKICQFPSSETEKVIQLLQLYQLPVKIPWNISEAIHLIRVDKKRKNNEIRFVLLKSIGKATTKMIAIDDLELMIKEIVN